MNLGDTGVDADTLMPSVVIELDLLACRIVKWMHVFVQHLHDDPACHVPSN